MNKSVTLAVNAQWWLTTKVNLSLHTIRIHVGHWDALSTQIRAKLPKPFCLVEHISIFSVLHRPVVAISLVNSLRNVR